MRWLPLLLLLAGCIDTTQEFVVNPDGSGKVRIVSIIIPSGINLTGQPEEDPEALMLDAVRDEITKCEGVDAWSDVKFNLRDDGKISFQGLAYFRDLSKLKLHNQGMKGPFDRMSLSRDPDGRLVLQLRGEEKKKETPPAKVKPEDIKSRMIAQRQQNQRMKGMISAVFTDFNMRIELRLPGRIESASGFKRDKPAQASIRVEGAKLIELFETLMSDDAWLRRQTESGRDAFKEAPTEDDEMMKLLFGQKGAPRVVSTAQAPQFDYAGEVAAAKKGRAALMKRLQAREETPAAPPSTGGAFKSLRVGGVQIVHFSDMQKGIRPLNAEKGLKVSLVGVLPGTVLDVKGGRLEEAVADNGDDLMPAQDWDRKLHFPQLAEDKTTVVFDVKMNLPGEGANGISKIRGFLEYTVGGRTKDVDLGIGTFRNGETGSEMGARITSLQEAQWQPGHQVMALELNVDRSKVKSVEFRDSNGAPLEVNRAGWMSSGKKVTMNFSIQGAFPAAGRIVVKVYDDLKVYRVPFELKDLDLLGRSR